MNRDTHSFEGARTARLRGWRRIWRYTTLRQVAYLTVVPDADSTIDGLIAPVPDQDWDALDNRERAYNRVSAAHQITHTLPHQPEIAVYAVPEDQPGVHSQDHTLLLSYIDVVVQGYLREFGPEGVERFFTSTSGWDAPVVNDRPTPRYPRHCALTRAETALVDDHLQHLRVKIRAADAHPNPEWRE